MVEIENMESYVARRGDPEEQDPLMTFVKILRYEVRPGTSLDVRTRPSSV